MRTHFGAEAKLVYGTTVSLVDFLGKEPLIAYRPDLYWWVLFSLADEGEYGMDILPMDDGGYGVLMEYAEGICQLSPPVGGFGYWAGMGNGGWVWTLTPMIAYRPHRQHRWVRLYPSDLLEKIDRAVDTASPSFSIDMEGLR